MKSSTTYLFLFITSFTFSQNSELNKDLEDYFRDYSKALVDEDLNSELDLMYPTLFQNYTKEKIISDYEKDYSKKDTTAITETKNHLVAIKGVSKSTIKNNKEYRIIDYILIKKITFSKEFIESEKKDDSISKLGIKNRTFCNVSSRRDYTVQSISFDKKTRIGIYSYHRKILAVRDLDSQNWWFISDKWWNFIPKTKKKRSTGWTIPWNYKKRSFSNINLDIPNSILKEMRKKTGYNTV